MDFFREVIGGITDAWYIKPRELCAQPASQLKAAAVYGQAIHAEIHRAGRPSGFKFDFGFAMKLKNRLGFALDYALLFPLGGLNYAVPQVRRSVQVQRSD